jgi:RimJ/RimL family protein N-acetyltransferase
MSATGDRVERAGYGDRMHSMRAVSGPDYLELATRLLQRARLEHPTCGLLEAADLQWWWRSGRSSDSIDQAFWIDEVGQPVGAVVFTDWRRAWGCDLLVVPRMADELVPTMWSQAVGRIRDMPTVDVEVAVRDDDPLLIGLVTGAGFAAADARGAATWMDAARRPGVTPIPHGHRLRDRTEAEIRPHHLVPRSGADVAERLAATSLYRPDLDLFIETAGGAVAAYGLFWFDPTTSVGLVEPMRTEQGHEGKGLGRHVLHSGLERLAGLGATRLKVYYEIGNRRAERLYHGAGFTTESVTTIYTRYGSSSPDTAG